MIDRRIRAQCVCFSGNKILLLKRSEFNPVQPYTWDFGEYIITAEEPFTVQLQQDILRYFCIGADVLYDCNEFAIPVATYFMNHTRENSDGSYHHGIVFGADLYSERVKFKTKTYSDFKFVTINELLAMYDSEFSFGTLKDVAITAMAKLQISTVSYF